LQNLLPPSSKLWQTLSALMDAYVANTYTGARPELFVGQDGPCSSKTSHDQLLKTFQVRYRRFFEESAKPLDFLDLL
jgi:hypothetical protein